MGYNVFGNIEVGLWLLDVQWRFGIIAVGLQMAIELNEVKLNIASNVT